MPPSRVLIVDDQRDIRRVLRAALETLNKQIQITDVPSGEEAILVISRQPVDMLISDVRLPGISGLELIERARVRNPGLRLVLITGLTDDKIRRQVELAHADAFFYKPISIDAFLDGVKQILDLEGVREPLPSAPQPSLPETPVVAPRPATRLAPLQPHDTRPVITYRQAAEPAAAPLAPKPPLQLVQERLAALRKHLDAELAAVVTPAGEKIATDGRTSESIQDWAAAMEIATGFAASPAARMRGLAFVPGVQHDFLVASVNDQALLLAGGVHPAWQDTAFGRLADALWAAAGDMRAAGVSTLIVPPPAAASSPSEDLLAALEEDQSLPDLSVLFDQAQSQNLNGADVDAFWDTAAEDLSARESRPGAISFEQARQLGLAPDED